MKLKNNTWYALCTLLLIAGISFFIFSQGSARASNIVSSEENGNFQIIKLHVENSQYILQPDTVKKGIPVRIEADISKMPGCSKSIVIPGFNIRQVVNENNNAIQFTPDKAGTFNIVCSMNMYKGTLTVLDTDGTQSSYTEQPAKGGSCGGSGGGCGCGSR